MNRWKIGERHPVYGIVCAMCVKGGEPYRFFNDPKDGSISLIPLDALNQ